MQLAEAYGKLAITVIYIIYKRFYYLTIIFFA
jgi:hypothetical protein